MVIAIDGYSSTGKSTLAKEIAREIEFVHVDSGAMYRAITYFGLQNCCIKEKGCIHNEFLIQNLSKIELDFRKVGNQNHIFLNGKDIEDEIRTSEVSENVSQVAQIAEVRTYLVDKQREMAQIQNLVMDGRDIGTVVFPDAEMKFFVTADLDERAKRRYKDLNKTEPDLEFEEVKQNLAERDKADTEREISPLRQAPDAVLIDNTHQTKEETVQEMLSIIYTQFPELRK